MKKIISTPQNPNGIKVDMTAEEIAKLETDIENSTDREQRTKKWYKERWNYISKCNDFMNLKAATYTSTDLQKTYMVWRLARAKSQSKVLRGATLKGDLMAISGFNKWCYNNKIRKIRYLWKAKWVLFLIETGLRYSI